MDRQFSDDAIHASRRYEASAERVFDAWLDPAVAAQFLFTTPTSQIEQAEIDARVGGAFVLVDRRGSMTIKHVGEYLEIERPRRLVFTFAVPQFSPDATCVTVETTPAGTGCELVLTHEGVPPEWRSSTADGWVMILDGLAAAL